MDDPRTRAEPPFEPTRIEPPPPSSVVTTVAGPPPPAQGATSLAGRFGRYDIQRLLGRGGMGAVYLAKQTDLDRLVVIKVILSAGDADAIARFQREARAAARVSSDNVVQVHETGVEQGVPFIAMEYVDGCSGADLLKQKGRLGWAEATQLVSAAAVGLGAAHKIGLLHRDVKPANILVSKDGRVKVADFGLAKVAGDPTASNPKLTASGMIVGTPHYMSPEQADGAELDARADIYSLGVAYFELLTGKRPFDGGSALRTLSLLISAPTPSPRQYVKDLPSLVERACLKLMARDKAERPQTVDEVLKLLGRISALSVSGRAPAFVDPEVKRPEPPPRSTPGSAIRAPSSVMTGRPPQAGPSTGLLVVGGLAIAALALGGLAVARSRPSAPAAPVAVVPPAPAAPSAPPPESPEPEPPSPRSPMVVIEDPPPAPPPAREPIAPKVPEPVAPKAPEGPRPSDFDAAWGDTCTALAKGDDPEGVERKVTDMLKKLPPNDMVDTARFTMLRGWSRVVRDKLSGARSDLDYSIKVCPNVPNDERSQSTLVTAHYMSFCAAMIANDKGQAQTREDELRNLVAGKMCKDAMTHVIGAVHWVASGHGPPDARGPFGFAVWTYVRETTFEKLQQRR